MSDSVKSVVTAVVLTAVRMIRGRNDLTGSIEYCHVNVPNTMLDRMVSRSDLESATGEKINVEVGSSRANLLYIDSSRDMIFGHQSAVKYVPTKLSRDQIIAAEQRLTAITTIGGQLARVGYEFPKDRIIANMAKWNFTIDDLRNWGIAVGKWNRIETRLKSYGLVK